MRLLRGSSPATAVLSTALAVALFSTTFAADSSLPNLSTITNQPPSTATESSKAATTASPGSNSGPPPPSSTTVHITGSGIAASSQSVPSISNTAGGAAETDLPVLTGLPKLPGAFSIPVASVPPTQNAPYMQVSNLPEGTVFIAVGAFLGFLAVCVLAWRGLIAWSLHRSVKRAAMHQDLADTKAMFRTPAAPTFKYSDRESVHSMSNFAAGKGGKRTRPSTASHVPTPSQSLFFSPTAGAAGAGSLANANNRASNYLPAGYYAAGASAPGNGAGMTHIGSGSRENINLANLRPNSQGYTRARSLGPSPPDSPTSALPPTLGHRLIPSTSSLDLNPRTTAPRAPSAYLEDLFDEAGTAPGQHPRGGRS